MIEVPSSCLSQSRELAIFDSTALIDNFERQSKLARRYLLSYIEDSRPKVDEFLKCLHLRDIDRYLSVS